MALNSEKKSEIIADYGVAPADTGSPEVQVALLSAAHLGTYRAFQRSSERSSFAQRSVENGEPAAQAARLPEIQRPGALSKTDRSSWTQTLNPFNESEPVSPALLHFGTTIICQRSRRGARFKEGNR